MNLHIRSETPADYEAIREVNEQAFGRPHEARIVEVVRQSPAFIPDLCLVAERDDEILGHVLFSLVAVEGDTGTGELLALGPIAVRPSWQRQGIGSRLIHAGLERAAAQGHRGVVLIGHPAYYPRFGFTPARAFGLDLPFAVPDEVFMALPLRPDAFEGIGGTVIFPPVFSQD